MDKFDNKYRIPSARLAGWDYNSPGAYFITICTKNYQHFFGEVYDGQMELNQVGKIAKIYWEEIPVHFPSIMLDGFVIMPNHIHGVLIMNESDKFIDDAEFVETLHATSDDNHIEALPIKNQTMSKISPKSGSISTIIRSYKSIVTKNARVINFNFAWQSRFHDHIIKNNKAYDTIINYIETNPYYWKDDKFFRVIV